MSIQYLTFFSSRRLGSRYDIVLDGYIRRAGATFRRFRKPLDDLLLACLNHKPAAFESLILLGLGFVHG